MKKVLCGIFVIALLLTACKNRENHKGLNEDIIVLSVLAGQSTSDAGIEDMIDEALAQTHPNVKLEWECVDWGEQFNNQMRGKLAAGDIPDIIIGKAQDVIPYASTGNLAPISDKCSSKITEDILKSVTVNGQVYGLPYNAWYQGVIYNKDIFNELGLTVPKTQEDMKHIITILNKNKITPFACHLGEVWQIGNMSMQFFMNDIFRSNQQWGDDFRAGKVGFESSKGIQQCLKYNKDILENTWSDAMSIDQFESDSRFTEGKAAMYLTGSWSMQFTDQYSADVNFGIFPYPNEKGNSDLIRETNMTFMISNNTEHLTLISDILYHLVTDKKLVKEILSFTETTSVINGIESSTRNKIQDDIDWYEENNKVIDVSLGNSQLVWEYQKDLASQQIKWLNHEITFKQLLEYADKHRAESKY